MIAFLIAAQIASAAPAAHADDAGANAVYERMGASFAALDPAGMEQVYSPDATYLPRDARAGIDGRDTIRQGTSGFMARMRKDGGSLQIKFRIVERKRLGNVIVDNGYVRSTMKLSASAPERVTNGKFVTVLAKQPAGHWAFVTDADSDTPAANFDNAKAVPGLKFDL